MTDLFSAKAGDWDADDAKQQLSAGIASAMLSHINFTPDMQVMDFGAGTGLVCGHIAAKVGRVLAVDISPAMLERLAAKEELKGKVDVLCQDILQQPTSDKFDVIVSAMAMHHVEDTKGLMQTLLAHLNPGGKVAIADLDTEDGSFHPADIDGVYHDGFGRDALAGTMEAAGFTGIAFDTAYTVLKDCKTFPIFLVTATKG
ncbi:MAG: methyltransferase type 12 [Zetaproteobacteria bacterium CG2_30_46_52]|nr:MAG: methyltransferase type 12 [Zetaproteobacteria bacterium CG2_30_46_52]